MQHVIVLTGLLACNRMLEFSNFNISKIPFKAFPGFRDCSYAFWAEYYYIIQGWGAGAGRSWVFFAPWGRSRLR